MAALAEVDLPFVDMADEAFRRDPHRVLQEWQARGPLIRTSRGIEVLYYDWIMDLLADERLITGGYDSHVSQVDAESRNTTDFHTHGLLVTMSGEKHARIRRVQSKAFTLRRVNRMRSLVREVAERLIDRFAARGSADLVWEFTHLFSIEVLCRTIGIPTEDIPLFDRATLAVAHSADDPAGADAGLGQLKEYVANLIASRRAIPADDLVSAMIAAQETEGRLSEDEVIWNIVNLMFAGHDTTRFQLASIARTVIEQGIWETLAASPDLVPAAVTESIRFGLSVPYPPKRLVTEDVEYRGLTFARGTWLHPNLFAASRDVRIFPDPNRFDIHRTGVEYDTFGHGLHYCLGFGLATVELQEGLAALTSRLTGVRVTSCESVDYPALAGMLGPRSLKVTFAPR